MSKNTPKRRFKEFSDNWERNLIGEIANITIGEFVIKNKQSDNGLYPVYNGGVSYTGKYDEYNNKGPKVIISARGANAGFINIVNGYYWAGNSCYSVSLNKDSKYNINYLYYFMKNNQNIFTENQQAANIPSVSKSDVEKFPLWNPSITEQKQIGDFFQKLDNMIELQSQKIYKYEMLKESYLEKMFPQNKEVIPKFRFKGFNDEWERCILDDMCTIITKQTGFDYSATIKPSLTTIKSSDSYSFIQNKDFNGENINLNTDFYIPIKVAELFPKIVLDTPSLLISISGKIGNVGYYKQDQKAFIGGAVGICKLKKENGSIIVYSLQTKTSKSYFDSLTKASSHANITIEDIRRIEIKLPSFESEIKMITKFFRILDNLITLQQSKLDKLKNLKQAYLNEMFVN